jgi:stage II sporulation protein D
MRIGIEMGVPNVMVGSSVNARILNQEGTPIADVEAMQPLQASLGGEGVQLGSTTDDRLYLQPLTPDGLVFIQQNWYRGLVELIPGEGGLIAVNQVGIDDYVSSVVGAEMGHRFPPEALKAQAVAARSYALFHRNLRLERPFDLGDDQSWQVYKGVSSESNLTQVASQETSNQVLTFQGQVINAVFHSSSGGHTEDVANVWTEPLPYLKGVPDFDVDAPVFSWSETISAQLAQQNIGGVGSILNLEVVQRSPYGRAMTVAVTGTGGSKSLSADQFRKLMGLKSTMFSISPVGGSSTTASLVPVANAPLSFQINGRGFGHGIGMSQWGAAGLAQQGWSYEQILKHYYQGASIAALQ